MQWTWIICTRPASLIGSCVVARWSHGCTVRTSGAGCYLFVTELPSSVASLVILGEGDGQELFGLAAATSRTSYWRTTWWPAAVGSTWTDPRVAGRCRAGATAAGLPADRAGRPHQFPSVKYAAI